MSKVIFLSYPLHGHTNPTLGLVKELVERGETVIYYSSESFREKIQNTGAIFRGYPIEIPKDEKGTNATFADGVEELFTFFTVTLKFGQAIMAKVMDETKSENPDYIIHDSYAFWGKLIASALNVPGISSVTTMVFNKRLVELDPDLFLKCFIKMSPQAMLRKYGVNTVLEMTDNMAGYFKSMFNNIGDFDFFDRILNHEELNIVYTSRMIQIHEECLDDSFKFVGPSIRPPENKLDFPFEKLTEQPLVYISLGTTLNRRLDFYKNCIEAFRDSEVQVVMAVGNKVDITELGAIPANFIVRNYLPQLEVLQRASVFITHGGFNSSSEGIYYHVPLVLFPQNTDQFVVAERMEQLGAGIYVRNPEIPAEELKNLIGKVLSDSTFKNNCAAIAASFQGAGGYQRAVDEIFAYKIRRGIR